MEELVEKKKERSGAKIWGFFIAECFRDNKLIWTESTGNIITNEGLDRFLNVMLHATTQTATWYCGLVETNTAPAAAMTYNVPVFTESTAYAEATRPAYVEAASTARSTTNSANKAVFTINDIKTMYGAALFSINTKGDHTAGADNVLLCYAIFGTSRAVISGDIINLTYTITIADDGV